MRRLISLGVSLLVLCAGAFALDGAISVVKIYDGVACAKSSTNLSAVINMDVYRPDYTEMAVQASVAAAVAGTPEISLTYEVSADGTSFYTPTGPSDGGDVVTNLTSAGHYQIDPGVIKFIRFKAVATDATNGVLNAWVVLH